MLWFVLALSVAVLKSAQDILSKQLSKTVSPYVIAWGCLFFSIPLLLLFLPFEYPIHLGSHFWMALLSATICLSVASLFLFKAIQSSDLSLSIPMLSFTSLFLLITSPLIVKETPSFLGLCGILLIILACYILFFHFQQKNILAPFHLLMRNKGARYMIIVAFIFSIGGNIDKVGILESSPIVWSFSLNTCVAFVLGVVMLLKVPKPIQEIRPHFWVFLLLGVLLSVGMILQMQALLLAKVSYVLTVKRVSIILSSLWGLMFLKEPGGLKRIWVIVLMMIGLVLISLGQ